MAKKRQELGPTAIQVATNVRRLRQGRGMSIDALVSATQGRLSRDAVKKIEAASNPGASAVRRVDADDLMVLALALGVTPNALLLPPTVNGNAYITGRGEVPSATAWEWANGQRPINPDHDDTETYGFLARTRPRRTPAGY